MKKLLSILLPTVLIISATPALTQAENQKKDDFLIKQQVDTLIENVDINKLIDDSIAGNVDYSVPLSIRENIFADAELLLKDGVSEKDVNVDVNSTVQKVGEVYQKNGEKSNLYVAVAAADVKVDYDWEDKSGVRAYASVYWIDHPGPENELYAVSGEWEPNGKVLENRKIHYGTSDPAWNMWIIGPKTITTEEDYYYYEVNATYIGLTLRCQTEAEIVNVGTIKCNVGSRIVT